MATIAEKEKVLLTMALSLRGKKEKNPYTVSR